MELRNEERLEEIDSVLRVYREICGYNLERK